jgi:hypothetical protein
MTKTPFIPSAPGKSASDYEVSASSKFVGYRRYFGFLKVVRKTDNKVLFPFEGAPELGPFPTREEAQACAATYGRQIVAGDLANPEL